MNRVKRIQVLFAVSVLADILVGCSLLSSLHNQNDSAAIAAFGLACNLICQLALLLFYFKIKMDEKEV